MSQHRFLDIYYNLCLIDEDEGSTNGMLDKFHLNYDPTYPVAAFVQSVCCNFKSVIGHCGPVNIFLHVMCYYNNNNNKWFY